MSMTTRLGLGVIALVGLGALGLSAERWLAGRGAVSDAVAQTKQIASLEAAIRRAQEEIDQPDIEVGGEGEDARWELPGRVTVLDHLEHLERAAQESGVTLDKVRLPERAPTDHLPAAIEASGPPDGLARFIAMIEAEREALVISRMRTHVDKQGVVHLDATVVGYGRTGTHANAAKAVEGTESEAHDG